jgi:hypothetical protein
MSRRVSLIAVAAVFLSSPASALQVELRGDQIILSAGVERGDVERFLRVLGEGQGKVTTVILKNSPGGDAFVGMRLAQAIRERGLRTAVSGYCRSACARIFLGGATRHSTDERKGNETYIGFHGTYEGTSGLSTVAYYQREWYTAMTDRKLDPELVARWSSIRNSKGFMYFYDPNRYRRQNGVSIVLCQGTEKERSECEEIAGTDGYAQGVYTSPEIVKINKPSG